MARPEPYVLPDVLQPGLDVVFCGTAPSLTSARVRAYYGNPQNRFWPTLHEVGLTPRLVAPEDYVFILRYGLGLTDVCKTAKGMDAKIPRHAFDPAMLWRKIGVYRPARLAFTSLRAAREGLEPFDVHVGAAIVDLGVHQGRDAALDRFVFLRHGLLRRDRGLSYGSIGTFNHADVWVMPSTSPAARPHFQIAPWRALAHDVSNGYQKDVKRVSKGGQERTSRGHT